jgi:hypothetical protein
MRIPPPRPGPVSLTGRHAAIHRWGPLVTREAKEAERIGLGPSVSQPPGTLASCLRLSSLRAGTDGNVRTKNVPPEPAHGEPLRRTTIGVGMTTDLAPDDESSRIAVHEAGHCLSLWWTGPGVDCVKGRAIFPLEGEAEGRQMLWCGLAGVLAEEHLGVQQPSGCDADHDRVATARNKMVEDEQARTGKRVTNQMQYDMNAKDELRRLFKCQETALHAVAERIRRARRSGEEVSGRELAQIAADHWVGNLPKALTAQLNNVGDDSVDGPHV